MDKHTERLDAVVKRFWGPDARLSGAAAKDRQPGRFDIQLGKNIVGTGPTFQAAINQARRSASSATIGERH